MCEDIVFILLPLVFTVCKTGKNRNFCLCRALAQKWHPDHYTGEEKKKAEKMFIDIAAAKEVLTDEGK